MTVPIWLYWIAVIVGVGVGWAAGKRYLYLRVQALLNNLSRIIIKTVINKNLLKEEEEMAVLDALEKFWTNL